MLLCYRLCYAHVRLLFGIQISSWTPRILPHGRSSRTQTFCLLLIHALLVYLGIIVVLLSSQDSHSHVTQLAASWVHSLAWRVSAEKHTAGALNHKIAGQCTTCSRRASGRPDIRLMSVTDTIEVSLVVAKNMTLVGNLANKWADSLSSVRCKPRSAGNETLK